MGEGGGAGGAWPVVRRTLTNTERAVISKHRLLHCDTEHLYSPVPWEDGEGVGVGGLCQNNHINNNDNNYLQAQ